MDSFSSNTYGQESGRMGQQDNYSSSGVGRDNSESYSSSRRDDYGGSNQSSGFGGQRENNSDRMPNMDMSNDNFGSSRTQNDSYGTGNSGGGYESGSRRENNEYGSGGSGYGASSSSGYGSQKESFEDKMIDKAAQYAKEKW